jgi:hypothetical protein
MDADVIYRLGERCGACRSERGAGTSGGFVLPQHW